MRIVGEIAHPRLKITIFRNDGRFSVKFEQGLLEQTYKFRDDERLTHISDVQKMIDPPFIQKIEDILRGMQEAKIAAFERTFPTQEAEFDTII